MFEKLLEDTQDKNIPVSNLLRRAKVLANRLDETEFLKWLDLELNGYGKNTNKGIPEYRRIFGEVKAFNPYRGWIPVVFTNDGVEDQMSRRYGYQSVSEFEELLNNSSETYAMPFPDSVANQVLEGPFKTKVSLMIGRNQLVAILNGTRNKLFDWLLALDKKGLKDSDVATEKQPVYEEYDVQRMLLKFGGKEIELSKKNKETDAVLLMRTLAKAPERYWFNDEIYEDWQALPQDIAENKTYHAARKINDAVKDAMGIEDFIDHNTAKFRINQKYLKG